MADEVKEVVNETETTAQTTETKTEVTAEVKEEVSQPEIELDNIEKDEDGNFILKVEGSETVYKAKTKADLIKQVSKGISEKDNYIKQLKEQASKGLKAERPKVEEEVLDVKYPERRNVFNEVFKQNGIPAEYINYTDDDWAAMETQVGAVKAFRLSQRVDEVKRLAEAKYTEANVEAINTSILKDETSEVEDLLAEYEIPASEFGETYNKILAAIYADPKNFNQAGVLKGGKVVTSVAKAVRLIAREKETQAVTKKHNEETASAVKKTKEAASETATRKPITDKTEATPKSSEEAVREILRDLKKYGWQQKE